MAKSTNSKQTLSVEYSGFGGIDTRNYHKGGIQDALNLRILSDGSLQKRRGYRCIQKVAANIRAIWSGVIGGVFSCYYLVGSNVYKLNLQEESSSLVGILSPSTSKVQFFYYRDALYLTDNERIYKIQSDGISAVAGYVPLLGKNWGTGHPGEINEPLNLLHRRARITYKIEEGHSAYLPTLYPVQYIEALYKNGVLLATTDYSFDSRFNTINISNLADGDELVALLTFTRVNEEEKDALLSNTSAYVFGGINNSRLLMWGGEVENTIFISTHVSEASLAESKKYFPNSDHFYFCADNHFTVGDGRYSVKAVTRHFDRLLILTEGDTWMADSSSCDQEKVPIMNVNSRVGCCSEDAVISIGNDPVSVGEKAIFRWTSDTDELNDCNAYSISDEISALLPAEFFSNAKVFADRYRGEVWFAQANGDGTAWIYNTAKKAWTRFNNIRTSAFFDANGEVGFINDDKICVFDDEYYSDCENTDGTDEMFITASLKSGIIDFASAKEKRLKYFSCLANLNGSRLNANITTDRGESVNIQLGSKGEHAAYSSRIHSHRHSFLSFTLSMPGSGRQTLQSLKLEAK